MSNRCTVASKRGGNVMTQIQIPVSLGDLIDRITVLEIKAERISDESKLSHVQAELAALESCWHGSPLADIDVQSYKTELKKVNETLWEIEDYLRIKEDEASFDEQFIELARAQYKNSDRRADIKRTIDERFGSEFVDEKSYPEYNAA
jgi:hypothetical protein